MASMVSILLALLVTFNASGTINPVNPENPTLTGNMSTPGKSRLGAFQKILPAEPGFSSRKPRLSFVLSFQFEKLHLECHYENKRHQLTGVDYFKEVDNKQVEIHVVPSYDKNGNMKCFVHQYKYNYKNQLKEVATGTGLNVEYKYDALGRRTEKIVKAPGGNKVTRYVNAGWRVLEERDENNALLKRYTYGNGIDEQVSQEYKTNNGLVTVLPMYDSTGNMIGITDDTGKLLEKYSYSVFGMPEFDYDINPPVIKSIYIGDGMFITDFSEPVKLESVTNGLKIKHEGVVIDGTFESGANGKEIKFIPATPLQPGQMSVEIAETVEDECGNQMGSSFTNNFIYSETTTIVHDDSAPEVDRIEKSANDFIVTFSERIDPDTTTDSIEIKRADGTISGSITIVDERTCKFTPEEMLEAHKEYKLYVNSTIKDLSGKSLNQFFHSFMVLPDDFLVYEKPDPNKHVYSRIGNNYLFHGREYEPEVGLYFYRNRYYMPRIGRFLQTDPMQYQDSMNLYQAFNMNPINFTDPMGNVIKAEYGKHDILSTQEVKTGKWYLDYTVIGAFNELRNAAALGINLVSNLFGTSEDIAYDVGDYGLSKVGIIERGELRDDPDMRTLFNAIMLTNPEAMEAGTRTVISKLDDLTYSLYRLVKSKGGKVLDMRKNIIVSTDAELSVDEISRVFGKGDQDYRKTFFDEFPDLKGKVTVHHSVEQQTLIRYPEMFTEAEIHSLENLRGIPTKMNPDLHLSKIRKEWNKFYKQNPTPTKEQILEKAAEIDEKYGHLFDPGR